MYIYRASSFPLDPSKTIAVGRNDDGSIRVRVADYVPPTFLRFWFKDLRYFSFHLRNLDGFWSSIAIGSQVILGGLTSGRSNLMHLNCTTLISAAEVTIIWLDSSFLIGNACLEP